MKRTGDEVYSTKGRTSLHTQILQELLFVLFLKDVSLISSRGILLDSSPLLYKTIVLVSRIKLKASEYRGEQAEMNIQRLNVRIDQVTEFYSTCKEIFR